MIGTLDRAAAQRTRIKDMCDASPGAMPLLLGCDPYSVHRAPGHSVAVRGILGVGIRGGAAAIVLASTTWLSGLETCGRRPGRAGSDEADRLDACRPGPSHWQSPATCSGAPGPSRGSGSCSCWTASSQARTDNGSRMLSWPAREPATSTTYGRASPATEPSSSTIWRSMAA